MINGLDRPPHKAFIRNTLRVMQHMDFQDDDMGIVYDHCFQYILDPKQDIAIRAFSMTVCTRIVRHFPEMTEELIVAMEDAMRHGSAGIRSRGSKMIASLRKGKF
jgi:hypothetical protein